MKKLQIKTIIGASLLALMLAGCGNQEATTDLENPVKEESVEETTSEKVNEEKQTEEEESAPETVEEEQTQEEESVPEVVEEVTKIEKVIPKHLEIKNEGESIVSYNYIEQDGKAILTDMSIGGGEVHYNYMTDDNGKIKFGLGLDYMFEYFNRRTHDYYVNREPNYNLTNIFGEWNFADCPLITSQEEYWTDGDGSIELSEQLSFEYDSNEKLTRIISNDNSDSESYEVVDLGDNVYSATYKYSREPDFNDSGEETAIFTLDGNGNALQIEERSYYKDDQGESESSYVTSTVYDAQNNMVREEGDFGNGTFEIHEYSYDESGNVTEIKQYYCEGDEQNMTDSAIISYDENGNVAEEIAFLRDAEYDIKYEYDGTKVTMINVNEEIAYEFTYDDDRLSAIYKRGDTDVLGLSDAFSELIGKYTGIYNAISLGMRDASEVHFYYE